QLTLALVIAGDSPKLRLPFGAKYKLEVHYHVEGVNEDQSPSDQTLNEKGNNPEAILKSVQDKIIDAILLKVTALGTGTAMIATAPDNRGALSSQSNSSLFSSITARPRLVVQTSHTSMVTD